MCISETKWFGSDVYEVDGWTDHLLLCAALSFVPVA